ncbi:hypothetical protein [Rhodococcus sp. SGAir0479]|uniref:hypothetical protein n=1 Tax=Rhodococcus sp. SGAir0479 TaxID=2567884 RepID=UPI001585D486|nr:hypothetical protein [Rhodococcus sp. SGAir0479]
MADDVGRALENVSALSSTGRTWESAFEWEPHSVVAALIVEPEPFPDDPNGTIVLGGA